MDFYGHWLKAWIEIGRADAPRPTATGTMPEARPPVTFGTPVYLTGKGTADVLSVGIASEVPSWPYVTQASVTEGLNKAPEFEVTLEMPEDLAEAFMRTPAMNLYNLLRLQFGYASGEASRTYKGYLQPPEVDYGEDGVTLGLKAIGVGLTAVQKPLGKYQAEGKSRRQILDELVRQSGYDGIDFLQVDGAESSLLELRPPETETKSGGKKVSKPTSFYVESSDAQTVWGFMVRVATDAQCMLVPEVPKVGVLAGKEVLVVRPLRGLAAQRVVQKTFWRWPERTFKPGLGDYPLRNFRTENPMLWLPGTTVDRLWRDYLVDTKKDSGEKTVEGAKLPTADKVSAGSKKVSEPVATTASGDQGQLASLGVLSQVEQPRTLGFTASWETDGVPEIALGEKVMVRGIGARFEAVSGYMVQSYTHTISADDWTTQIEAAAFGRPGTAGDGEEPRTKGTPVETTTSDGMIPVVAAKV